MMKFERYFITLQKYSYLGNEHTLIIVYTSAEGDRMDYTSIIPSTFQRSIRAA